MAVLEQAQSEIHKNHSTHWHHCILQSTDLHNRRGGPRSFKPPNIKRELQYTWEISDERPDGTYGLFGIWIVFQISLAGQRRQSTSPTDTSSCVQSDVAKEYSCMSFKRSAPLYPPTFRWERCWVQHWITKGYHATAIYCTGVEISRAWDLSGASYVKKQNNNHGRKWQQHHRRQVGTTYDMPCRLGSRYLNHVCVSRLHAKRSFIRWTPVKSGVIWLLCLALSPS